MATRETSNTAIILCLLLLLPRPLIRNVQILNYYHFYGSGGGGGWFAVKGCRIDNPSGEITFDDHLTTTRRSWFPFNGE